MTTLTLVLTAVGSVLLLLFLVMKARMHAFLALMVVSMGAGLFSGMPLDKIAATMEKGMGGTLGFLAVVVALGAMFGKILHETGAVDQIAVKMLKSFGHSRAHYAIGLAGLVCALPLFFEFSSCDCTLSPEFPAYSSSIGAAVGSPHADSNARLAADSAITLIAFDDSLLMFAPYDSSVLWLGLFD